MVRVDGDNKRFVEKFQESLVSKVALYQPLLVPLPPTFPLAGVTPQVTFLIHVKYVLAAA